MPLRPPEPGSFEHLLEEALVPADTLVRLSRYPRTEPWWSHGRHRFDGPLPDTPGSFGTCYAAQRLQVAFAESVIHECGWFRNGRYEVPEADLKARHIVTLQRLDKPKLVLADLTGKALKNLGLNNDVSAGDDYEPTMAWAAAIHHASVKWDGIRYVSRQHNDEYVVALFERSQVGKHRSQPLQGKQLDDLCNEFKVVSV